MSKLIKRLYAIGTRGIVKGKKIEAKRNINGKYVLNIKVNCGGIDSTNKAVNKVEVDTLEEAYLLLKMNEHLINLTIDSGKRALREFDKVLVEYI